MLALSTSIPLAALDLSDPKPFFLFLNIFAAGSYQITQKLIPERLTVCGGVMLADALDLLVAELQRVSR